MMHWRWIALAALATALAGCAPAEVKTMLHGKSEKELAAGIKSYEAGDYKSAQAQIQAALDAGLNKWDQVKAHKYLAFMHCVSGREKPCRDEFRKVLDINPNFELEPAEAGHPAWGPVFRSVKGKK